MKKLVMALCAATLLLHACSDNKEKTAGVSKTDADTVTAADPCAGYVADTANAAPMDSAMMSAWMAYATPGDMHKMLAKDEGEWESSVTQWMDPAAKPTVSKSKAVNKMVMGGRYQYSEHSGCFGGMPFEGMSLTGYDNHKKIFFSSWIDNMGTGVMNMEGPWDPVTKTIKLSGTCVNPMDGKQMNVREEFTYIDDNTQKMTMYGPDMKGKEFKTMEIVFTRKK